MDFVIDGRKIYAYTGGRPVCATRPLIVFIHGAQHDHSVWILQSRFLAHHGFSVLAVDLPGHGRSEGPPLASVEALADWTAQLIRAARLGPAHLVGHSMGSLIALETAARHQKETLSLALLGTAAPMRVSAALLNAAREDEARAFDMINAWSHSGITVHPGCPGPGFSIFNQNRRLMERQPPGVLHNDFMACNAYEGALASAARIQCPALVVSGSRDIMTPARAAKPLVEALRGRPEPGSGTTVVELADCGHAMMAEQPDRVLRVLRQFWTNHHA